MSTIPYTLRESTFNPVGATGPWGVGFPIFDPTGADLVVYLNGVEQTFGAVWTITPGTPETGFFGASTTWPNAVIYSTIPLTGELVIKGVRDPRRVAQFNEGGGVPARDQNAELNILTAVDQELRRDVDREVAARISDVAALDGRIDQEIIDRQADVGALDARLDAAEPVLADVAQRAVRVPSGETGVTLPSIAARVLRWAGYGPSGEPIPLDPPQTVIVDGPALVATTMAVSGIVVPALMLFFSTAGFALAGDGGGASFRRAVSEPSHAGKVQTADGAWWEIFGKLNAKQFGAVGGGSVDDAPAINACLQTAAALGGGDALLPRGVYEVAASAIVPSNVRLVGERGAKIKVANAANIHAIKFADDAVNAAVVALEIDGNKANQTLGGHGVSSGGTLAKSLRVQDCYIHDCLIDGVGFTSTTTDGAVLHGNIVEDCGGAGISCRTGTLKNAVISGNVAKRSGTHNIGVTSTADGVTICGNVCEDAGIADNITTYSALNKNVTVVGNICRRGGNNGIHVSGAYRIIVSDNIVDGPAQVGVSMFITAATVSGSAVCGNVITSSGASGIWMRGCVDGAVGNNVVQLAGAHGILLENSSKLAVFGNTVSGSTATGIRGSGTNSDHAITGNVVTANSSHGIYIPDAQGCSIVGNKSTANTSLGVLLNGAEAQNLVQANDLTGNTNAIGVTVVSPTTIVRGNKTAGTNSVASAATISIPSHTDFITLTGSTNVTGITASYSGRVVTLRSNGFTGTITDGGNLVLSSNMTMAHNSVITLICDGVNWYEMSRSAN